MNNYNSYIIALFLGILLGCVVINQIQYNHIIIINK